ncbi:BZ3500_MvSof-1268-A1-R1_Chr8-2g10259 [Microbotryum saponariae]|uniref:BZ3500_MvSof-1268-A1-R1_Chr8-2g10259 protein n=1 Tax=Microbotryum saponariae TaxID=289078 RepID=A0A2X0MQB7_9BASI|nr:BZ3500_MvSof-1268-A1-R1_Chr8-2g10259 [Microbotryum saponariae]SDA02057.1 BZ3501_MvSof-1269-A2-R1_Chr8-2g10009 [Microbotryum saponariae]
MDNEKSRPVEAPATYRSEPYKHEQLMQHIEDSSGRSTVSEHAGEGSYSNTHNGEELVKPSRMFTPEEEAKIWRKVSCSRLYSALQYVQKLTLLHGDCSPQVDLRLLPYLALLYLLSFMDRGNIGNARLAGLETDLKMTGNDYSVALSAFFISYCLFEVPSNLMLKKLRPSIWLSSITIVWGIVMTLMGVVHNFAGLVATRVALGIAEAGLFPGVILYLTLWYPRHMCQQRIAFFFSAATLAGAFSGLLAYGIQFMSGVGGRNGWSWIFILEGLLTTLAGVGAFWAIVDSPRSSHFLTKEEQDFIIWRKTTDSGASGEATNVSWIYIRQALTSWQCWLALGYYFGIVVPLYSIGLFMPTLIQAFGKYTRPQVQLLTIPVYVFACIYVLITAIYADRMKTRFPFVMAALGLSALGIIINLTPAPSGVKYFGLFLTAAGSYGGLPAVVTWLSNNLSGQTKRGVGSAFQIGIGNLGALVSSNVYRKQPRYFLGHGAVLGCIVVGLFCAPLYAFLLKRENEKKEREIEYQNSLPDHEKRVYSLQELRDLGDKHPSFVYTI